MSDLVVGNFLHGRKDKSAGFVSRLGVTMDPALFVPYSSTPEYLYRINDAHLIDFDMPPQTTPDVERDIGLVRWNKAILFGRVKSYSIAGGYTFGSEGWPYKAPDGSVWQMTAQIQTSPSWHITVIAKPLHYDVLDLAGTPELFSFYPPWSPPDNWFINFNPKLGNKAAIHFLYSPNAYSERVDQIVELTVSGGSVSAVPTDPWVMPAITHVVLYDQAAIRTNLATPDNTLATGGGASTSIINEGATGEFHMFGTISYPVYIVNFQKVTAPITASNYKTTTVYDEIFRVAYDQSGARRVLSARTTTVDEHGATARGAITENDRWKAWYWGGAWQKLTGLGKTIEDPSPGLYPWFKGTITTALLRDGSVVCSKTVKSLEMIAGAVSTYLAPDFNHLPRDCYAASNSTVAMSGSGVATPTYDISGDMVVDEYGFMVPTYINQYQSVMGFVTPGSDFFDSAPENHPLAMQFPHVAVDPSDYSYVPTAEFVF